MILHIFVESECAMEYTQVLATEINPLATQNQLHIHYRFPGYSTCQNSHIWAYVLISEMFLFALNFFETRIVYELIAFCSVYNALCTGSTVEKTWFFFRKWIQALQTVCISHTVFYSVDTGSRFSGLMHVAYKTHYMSPSSAEVKILWYYNSRFPSVARRCTRQMLHV